MSQLTVLEQARDTDKTLLGFWIYLMTDCLLFAALFATYAVLHHNPFDGPTGAEIFNLPAVLSETLILLTSSFTCGLAMLAVHRGDKPKTLAAFGVTFLLGLAFLGMELTEFSSLAADGNSWQRTGFLSAFFTLVGTHGIHISFGLLWMLIMILKVARTGLTTFNVKRLMMLSLFWHFLDVIWIFIFSVVYLVGVQ